MGVPQYGRRVGGCATDFIFAVAAVTAFLSTLPRGVCCFFLFVLLGVGPAFGSFRHFGGVVGWIRLRRQQGVGRPQPREQVVEQFVSQVVGFHRVIGHQPVAAAVELPVLVIQVQSTFRKSRDQFLPEFAVMAAGL